jgi:hypothetical protein
MSRPAFTYRATLARIRSAGGMTKTYRADLGQVTYHLMGGEAVWLEAAEALIRLGLVLPERDGLFGDDSQIYRAPDQLKSDAAPRQQQVTK